MKTLINPKTSFNLIRKKVVNLKQPSATSNFTFDLESMKQAINSPKVKIPDSAITDDDSFDKWLNE
ncbi:MAG: hypothetical protein WAX77_06035 [Methylococcaceae bacterium]